MSFGEIFQINCIQNGILAITFSEKIIHEIWRQLHESPAAKITIDLPKQSMTAPDGTAFEFEISPLRKDRLLRGMDDVDVTLQHLDDIERFEKARRAATPWLPGIRASLR
jgi:3-isopropylmalate/(R)-2-methylmalate dehydratase small subunit